MGDLGSIPGVGRSPGEGNDYPLQYSGLENSRDYSPWSHKEWNVTELLSLSISNHNRKFIGDKHHSPKSKNFWGKTKLENIVKALG